MILLLKQKKKFLEDGNKVRITVRFRGREVNYVKSGEDVLNKFIEELKDSSTVEKKPFLEGKNMFIILAPSK
jgi:translation initiation factor IF-3